VPPRLPGATAPFKAADVKRLDVHLQDVYAQLGRAKKELAEIFVK